MPKAKPKQDKPRERVVTYIRKDTLEAVISLANQEERRISQMLALLIERGLRQS